MWALLVFARVVEEQACCGRVCLWVAGVRVYARGVFVWVFALLGVGALVWWWGSVVPPPPLSRLACLRAHALVWACWRVRGCCVPDGWRAALLGRDSVVPPHYVCWWRCPADACAREERRVGGEGESASRVADTAPPAFALAYVGTGTLLSVLSRVGVGPPAGRVLAWLGACGVIARPGGEFVPTRG